MLSAAVRGGPRKPWVWIASRKVRSATRERNPNEKGRITSVGKGGTSSCISVGGGLSASALPRVSAVAATSEAKSAEP